MSLSLRRQFPRGLYMGNSVIYVQQPWPTARLGHQNLKRVQRITRQPSRLLGKSLPKRAVFQTLTKQADFQNPMTPLAMQNLYTQRFWFLQNALPVAAQLKPMKTNMMFGMQQRALLPLHLWVGQQGIHFLEKVAATCLVSCFHHQYAFVWNFIQALESYVPVTNTRSGWFSRVSEARFFCQHENILINGWIQKSAWYSLRAADVILIQNHAPAAVVK